MPKLVRPSQLTAFLLGVAVATATAALAEEPRGSVAERYRTLDAFAYALSTVANDYVDPVEETRLIHNAIRGMVNKLDKRSRFLPPKRYRRVRQDTEGEFAGVGLTMGAPPHGAAHLIVERVVSGSPAGRAGVRTGDALLAIDELELAPGAKPAAVHTRLRGTVGTRVAVTLSRRTGAAARTIKLTLVRELIVVPSVATRSLAGGVAYIKVRRFQEATARDLRRALTAAKSANARAVILDLRANPGGLFDQAVEVANLFLERGVIVSVAGRGGRVTERPLASAAGTFATLPLTVLVDDQTASAAEVLAAALQHHKRAKLLGLPTFGKGTVQTFYDLPDGSGLKLTTARFFTPAGKPIQGVGIKPDREVEPFASEDIVVGGPKPKATDANQSGTTPGTLPADLSADHQLAIAYRAILGFDSQNR